MLTMPATCPSSENRPVNEPNEHERGLFMFVRLSLNEHGHGDEHIIERKILFVFVHLAHEDVRVRLCSFVKILNEHRRTQTNVNKHKRTQTNTKTHISLSTKHNNKD